MQSYSGDPAVFQHLFWLYSHPAVYFMSLSLIVAGVTRDSLHVSKNSEPRIALNAHDRCMPRMARAVVAGAAHHVMQRGLKRQDVFASGIDREVYLRLAAASFDTHAISVLGDCLVSNHVHWVVVPPTPLAVARAFGTLYGRNAQHWNAVSVRSGHLWQNRFFSCALDEAHTWAAVRYAERNPVRAGMVSNAEDWPWSSAEARVGRSGVWCTSI